MTSRSQSGSSPRVDYSLERGLPASIEAERSVLGAIILDTKGLLYEQAAETLVPDHFSMDAHRRIFARMNDLVEANKPIDMVMLAEELERKKEVEAIGGVAYLSSLIDGVPDRPNIRHYCNIVRKAAMLRGIITVAQTAIAEAIDHSDEPDEVLARTEEGIFQLSEDMDTEGRSYRMVDSIGEAGGFDAYMAKILDPVAMTGIETHYVEIDRLIGGLQPGTFVIIAARPSMGKSSLAANIAENILAHDPDKVIAFFMLESTRRQFEMRRLAAAARVNIRKVAGGDYASDLDKAKLVKTLEEIAERSLCVDDVGHLTPMKLRARVRQLKRKMGRLDVVFVDYLQLMSGGRKFESREQEVSFLARSLKALAKELGVPVVALAQLSRSVEGRKDKRPILSDLRESGSIEQEADVVIFIHRPEVYEPNEPDLQGIAEMSVAKNRDGPTGVRKMAFLADFTLFANLAYESETGG